MAATYRFTFRAYGVVKSFGAESVMNWHEVKPKISRDENLRGVVSEYSNTFQFVGSARDFIIDIEQYYGIDAEVLMTIEIGNESGFESSFKQLGSELTASFKDYVNNDTYCSLSFDVSGFQKLVLNRWDTEVSLNSLTSIDGDAITGDADQTIPTILHVRHIDQSSLFNEGAWFEDLINFGADDQIMSLPLNMQYKGDEFSQSQPQSWFSGVYGTEINDAYCLYKRPNKQTIIKCDYDLDITAYFSSLGGDCNIGYLILTDGLLQLSSPHPLATTPRNPNTNEYPFTIKGSFEVDLATNQTIIIALWLSDTVTFNTRVGIYDMRATITTRTDIIDYPTTVNLLFAHDAIKRNLQLITGNNEPLYSPILGRDYSGDGYTYNGEHGHTLTGSGYMLRNFPYNKHPYVTSMKELVQGTLMKMYNLVCSFKKIDNKLKFVIESYDEAFDFIAPDSEIVTFDYNDIDVVDIEINEKMHYQEVTVGYKNQEYEEVNGVLPYNSEFKFAVPLRSVTNKLNLVCDDRADDIGIELKRRKQYVGFPTTDTKGDSDNWIIRGIVSQGVGTQLCEKNETFESVEGIYSPESAYNLNISPGRNLERWYKVLNSGCYRSRGKSIKYTVNEKNSALIAKKLNKPALVEAADIPIENLNYPSLLPYIINFSAKCDVDKWNAILANTNKPVKLFVKHRNQLLPLYGIFDEAEYNIDKQKIEGAKLTRVNR